MFAQIKPASAQPAAEAGKESAAKQEPGKNQGQEEGKGSGVAKIVPGDYMVHIHVQSIKNIVLEGESSSNPMVRVAMIQKDKATKVKSGVTSAQVVKYDEHIFIEFKNLTKEEFEESTIRISVENKGFFKSDLIGQFEMASTKIYNMEKHAMLHQLIALTNPNSEDFSKINGYVVCSIGIQGPNDEAIELQMGTNDEIQSKKPLIPSSVKKCYKQLYLRFYLAEDLPIMDKPILYGEGSIDAYIVVKYGSTKMKTSVFTMKNKICEWNEEMLVPIEIPTIDDKIYLQVWDQDPLADSLCCSMILSVKSLLESSKGDSMVTQNQYGDQTTESQMKWLNLYGAHADYSGPRCDEMNDDPNIASAWKGRLLVEYFTVDVKYPTFKKKLIDKQKAQDQLTKFRKAQTFTICGEIGSGVDLPKTSKKPQIKVSLGKLSWRSGDPVNSEVSSYARWDFQFKQQIEDTQLSLRGFPDLFVYLMDGDIPVCFWKTKVKQNTYQDIKLYNFSWEQLSCDRGVGQVLDQNSAGFFNFRMYIQQGVFEPKGKLQDWGIKFPKQLTQHKVRVNLYQCESLPPADEEGTSDPYVEIPQMNAQKVVRSKVCEDSNNPIFYEVLEFNVEFNDLLRAPPIIINIWDHDEGLLTDTRDFIGRAVVFLDKIDDLSNDNRIPQPAWIPVKAGYYDQYNQEFGASVLCSFQLVVANYGFAKPAGELRLDRSYFLDQKQQQPLNMPNLQLEEFKCEIMALGLRELVSKGLLPVRKAFVKFNLKSLLPPEQAKAIENIQTQPNASGPHPIIKTTLQFEIRIPVDPKFCPRMTCDVFDMLYFEGIPQPHLGTFTLKIGDLIQQEKEQDIERKKEFERTIRILQKIKYQVDVKLGQEAVPQDSIRQLVHQLDSQILRDREFGKQIVDDVGEKILQKLKESGIELPTSSTDAKAMEQLQKQFTIMNLNAKDQSDQLFDSINSNLRQQVELAFLADIKQKKKMLDKKRQEDMIEDGRFAAGNVVKPLYKYDDRLLIEREVRIPPQTIFIEIGYDPTPGAGKKHYRRYYPDELENVQDEWGQPLIKSPFITEKITRAAFKQKGWFGNLFGGGASKDADGMQILEVGLFKGLLRVYNEQLLQKDKQLIDNQVKEIQNLVNYIFSLTGIEPPFDFKKIDPQFVKDFNTTLVGLKELGMHLENSGLAKLKIYEQLGSYIFQQQLTKKLNETSKCKVRIYALEGFNFAQRDTFSLSDPYLILRCGKTEYNEQKIYQLDTSDPKFYKMYEFTVDFPGAPMIEIIANDYDDFFGDELIGKTSLDLDDRYFSQAWQSIEDKPVEYRDLFHPSSTVSQGVLKMWAEINQKDSKSANDSPIDISQAPVEEFECRVVIWKTKEVGNGDNAGDFEGCSDVYVRAFFDNDKDQLTDTHWRCSTGVASFNYRLILKVKSTDKAFNLTIQAWDKDIIDSNDLLGESILDIQPLMEDVILTKKSKILTKTYFDKWMKEQLQQKDQNQQNLANEITFEDEDKFWIPIRIERFTDNIGHFVAAGEILCSINVLPKNIAEKLPQGIARQEPNSDPPLPEPEGRLKLSVNPLEMIGQFIPPPLQAIIFRAIVLGLLAFLCVMMAPMIFANIITKIIVG